MSLKLPLLDDRTRMLMLAEIRYDLDCNNLHISPDLSGQGIHDFPSLLKKAVKVGNEESLANELDQKARIARTTHRRRPNDGFAIVNIPANAAKMIAEDAFNRYYIRAVCLRAIADGADNVLVYRAKPVNDPRTYSEELNETAVDPTDLLLDLRANTGEATEMGIPGGPNSGISVYI
jgi:hypothetical protein